MVYGLLKPSTNVSQAGQNEVRLQGTLGKDEKMEHLITFPTPSTAQGADNDSHSSDFLHCLAAKTFIQMKQEDLTDKYGAELEEAEAPIISVSKSANVVSKLTSFVAVDINSHQPVSGPLAKQVVPSFTGFDCGYSNVYASPGIISQELYGCPSDSAVYEMCGAEINTAPVSAEICDESYECPSDSAVYEMFGAEICEEFYECPDSAVDEGRHMFGAEINTAPVSASQQKKEGSVVLSLISLQKASGAWELTDQLLSLCSSGKDALITGCPTEIAVSTKTGMLLWATALALALLIGKFLDQKDEWEMIAEKGKKWLKKKLPGAMKYDTVLQSAAAVIGVQI